MSSPSSITQFLREDPNHWSNFTREEEYREVKRDRYGRFSSKDSLYDPLDPMVSTLLIDHGWEPHYPDDREFAICLTHDVDFLEYPRRTLIEQARDEAAKLRIRSSMDRVRRALSLGDKPIWNFDSIMDIEESYGATSTFFVMALKEGEPDHMYDLETISADLEMVRDRGFEFGLHGGHEAFMDPEKAGMEKKYLEKYSDGEVKGYRNHYLRFRTPETWKVLEKTGFEYDTTFGYHDSIGFRNGMCHPFNPYDLEGGRSIDILEIPLVMMDSTFLNYRTDQIKEMWERIRDLLEIIRSRKGAVSLLWHNNNFMGDLSDIYRKILDYGRENGAWMTSCEQLTNWWLKEKMGGI